MRKPVALDLFSGLGGFTEGLMAAGFHVIGMELDPRFIGRYPSEMIVQDVLTFSGYRARGIVDLVVASPPCTEPSYRAMPWKRAKALNAAGPPVKFIELFNACFRIADEIGCPVIIENVKGAQPWVGRAKWHYGSFYLWGSVPALMPVFDGEWKGFASVWADKEMHRARGAFKSEQRANWAAERAKIPFALSHHIGKVFMEDLCSRQSANF
jgi:hypothetical protein